MTRRLAFGRVALGLLVVTFFHFFQHDHAAAKAHRATGSTATAVYQAITEPPTLGGSALWCSNT